MIQSISSKFPPEHTRNATTTVHGPNSGKRAHHGHRRDGKHDPRRAYQTGVEDAKAYVVCMCVHMDMSIFVCMSSWMCQIMHLSDWRGRCQGLCGMYVLVHVYVFCICTTTFIAWLWGYQNYVKRCQDSCEIIVYIMYACINVQFMRLSFWGGWC